jgi:hypothetical protein
MEKDQCHKYVSPVLVDAEAYFDYFSRQILFLLGTLNSSRKKSLRDNLLVPVHTRGFTGSTL